MFGVLADGTPKGHGHPRDTAFQRRLDMMMQDFQLLAFSIREWFWSACSELVTFFEQMSTTQYGIFATATIAFGFLCLRGYQLRP